MSGLEPQTSEDQSADIAGVAVRPPVLILACLLVAIGIDQFFPLSMGFESGRTLFGALVCGGALIVFVLAVRGFSSAGTSVQTSQPSTMIVSNGIYGISRNPIYLSMCTFMAGLGLLLNSLWALLTLVVIVPVLRYGVIAREEAYLECKFGSSYVEYKKSVRRWF